MWCGRCSKPILPGEDYISHDVHSASGGGTTVYLHKQPCKRSPQQTTVSSLRH